MITVAFWTAVAAVGWWVLASPLRAALVPVLAVAAPPVPGPVLALVAVVLVAGAGWLIWRALAQTRWRLATVTRPATTAGGAA